MRRSYISSIVLAALLAYGCSLVNSPEELLNASSDNVGGSGGNNGTGGSLGGAPGNTGGSNTGGTSGAPVVAPSRGLFVLGANANGKRVLSALATNTGEELERVDLPVAALAYDEAPGRYVWFVFTAAKFPAQPTRTADLEVRRFDDAKKSWSVVSKVSGLPPPRADHLVVLNDRLAYLSYKVESGTTREALTVLDTSNLEKIEELATRTASDGERYIGLVGKRGSDTDPEAKGGALDLMMGRNCDADCELFAQPVFVSSRLVDGEGAVVDHFSGTPRFAASRIENKVYAAMYSMRPATQVEVRVFPADDPGNSTVFSINELTDDNITGFDLVECQKAGFVRTAEDTALVAFHLESGLRESIELGQGALLYGEPFGSSAIAFNLDGGMGGAGNAPLRAFEVEPAGAGDLVMNERSRFAPPNDLEPFVGATRYPEALECD